jgi:hypothetical protein
VGRRAPLSGRRVEQRRLASGLARRRLRGRRVCGESLRQPARRRGSAASSPWRHGRESVRHGVGGQRRCQRALTYMIVVAYKGRHLGRHPLSLSQHWWWPKPNTAGGHREGCRTDYLNDRDDERPVPKCRLCGCRSRRSSQTTPSPCTREIPALCSEIVKLLNLKEQRQIKERTCRVLVHLS